MDTDDLGTKLVKSAGKGFGLGFANNIHETFHDFFPTFGLKRQAIQNYIKEIKNTNMSPEAKMFAINNSSRTLKQMKNQKAIADIAQQVAQENTDFSSNSSVDNEWFERFMDSAKFVSDEQIQLMWGSVLAHEFEEPNSTPPSVIRILSEITPKYASIFCSLCSLAIKFSYIDTDEKIITSENWIIAPRPEQEYLNSKQIDFETLNELELLGLVRFNPLTGYTNNYNSKDIPKIQLEYGNDSATIIKYPDKAFPIGTVILTQAGKSLFRFTEKTVIDGHFDAVITYLRSSQIKFAKRPNQNS